MYISTYISSGTFAWSSKLTVDIDSMGPDVQLLGGHFSNFLLGKVSLEFKLHGMSIFHDIQMATYFGSAWHYSHVVGPAGNPTCTVYVQRRHDLDLIQGQGHGAFELPTIAHSCTILGLSPPPFRRGAQNWWLVDIVWDLDYSLSEPDFWISI